MPEPLQVGHVVTVHRHKPSQPCNPRCYFTEQAAALLASLLPQRRPGGIS